MIRDLKKGVELANLISYKWKIGINLDSHQYGILYFRTQEKFTFETVIHVATSSLNNFCKLATQANFNGRRTQEYHEEVLRDSCVIF